MSSPQVPNELVEAIRAGRCVAFVGAGFVQPTLPSWQDLLTALAERVHDESQREQIMAWLRDAKSNRDYEGLAETIKTALGDRFVPNLALTLDKPPLPATKRRLAFLDEVPFRAILTTNFDAMIRGDVPSPDAYAKVLTAPRHAWWDQYYWSKKTSNRPACIQLHGRVWGELDQQSDSKIVFSTRDYRRLLYEEPGYRAFLRAVFATHTILYMGFSFTDAYVNELRSEVLSMLGLGRGRGHDFAILNDVPPLVSKHLTDSEGLLVLGYSTHVEGSSARDFSGFDDWLAAIRNRAGPERTLHELVSGKRLLWLDPKPENNQHGFNVLHSAAELTKVASPGAALERLRAGNGGPAPTSADERYDLVISHFGYDPGGGPSNCERLLVGMRHEDLRAPVLVFSQPEYRTQNRRVVLELGAYAYTDTWEEFFQQLEELLKDGSSRR